MNRKIYLLLLLFLVPLCAAPSLADSSGPHWAEIVEGEGLEEVQEEGRSHVYLTLADPLRLARAAESGALNPPLLKTDRRLFLLIRVLLL